MLEGLAYRITPFDFGGMGMIDSDTMYRNMMTRFKYGAVNTPGIYLDETVMRMCQTHRRMFLMLANSLLQKGEKDKATKVLQKCLKELPSTTVPYTDDDSQLASLLAEAGNKKEAAKVAKAVLDYNFQYLTYLNSLGSDRVQTYMRTCYYLVTSTIEASHALRSVNDPQVAQYDKRIEQAGHTEAFQLGLEVYQQQMQ